jgi:23S rRNA (guanosine2251-2'-O)-methyltransferase
MSKKENKRFKDSSRSTAPKRGGKNRRDYGDSYEPKRKGAASPTSGRKPSRGAAPRRTDSRKVLGFDLANQYEDKANIGTDGLEVVAGRNPVTEALNGDRDVERVFIADGAEGSVSKIVAIAREQGVIVDFVP